jgi:zinc protease
MLTERLINCTTRQVKNLMKKRILIFLTFGVILPVQASTQEMTLDNGMKVVVREDHRAPVVVSQVWYRIGSSYEHDGITGVSHVLEHMMFKGTKDLKPGEFSEIIAANGGKENAFTSRDYTAYFQRIASDRLDICLKLEADRMRNVVFLAEEFKKEVAVVQEERRWRVDNKPKSKLFEQFYAAAFLTSPLRIPTIGWMSDLENLKMQDAAEWYKNWYAPNNATLVIVGDVKSEQVFALAKKYFADIKPSNIEPPKSRPEILQNGERRISLYGQTSNPYLIMGYKTPVLKGFEGNIKDIYALDVLSGILDGGNSARIAKKMLRGDEIAVEAGTSYDAFDRLAGLFLFAGTPNDGVSPQALENAFIEEIEDLQVNPVTQQELDRVKAQVIASKVFDRDSMFNMAMQIGALDSVGHDWSLLDSYVDNIRSISAEDIQRVANKYFDKNSLTVATLWPEQETKNQ